MTVHFHHPSTPEARNSVQMIFQSHGYPQFTHETILPKGGIEIIFDLSDRAAIKGHMRNNKSSVLPRCFVYGFSQTPIYLQLSTQQTYFGVVLQPVAVKALLGAPAHEFTDRWVDLTLVDPTFNALWNEVADAKEFAPRVKIIERWIAKQSNPLKAQEQFLNVFLTSSLHQPLSVPQVADNLCYSPRQLGRKINDITGMNTEEMLLYKKYLRGIELIHNSSMSLSEIAYESHFTDQSHFIKSFKTFTDLTPGEYAQRCTKHLPAHLFQNVR